MQAIVLAHERALTLEPFTTTRPRPMIPVLNTPVIGHVLAELKAAGIQEVLVTLGHLGEAVQTWLSANTPAGLTVRYATLARETDFPAWLADLLKKTEQPLLLVDSGVYMEAGLITALLIAWKGAPQALAMVALGTSKNPLYHDRAILAESGRLTSLQAVTLNQIKVGEQSPLPDMAAGVIAVSAQALGRLAEITAAQKPITFAQLLSACFQQGLPLTAAATGKKFITLDYPWEILGASFFGLELTFAGREPVRRIAASARVHPDAILKGTVILGENVVIESGAVLENVILDADCQVLEHSYLQTVVLGPKSSIGPMGFIRRTVLGPRSQVGYPGEAPWLIGFGKNGFGHHCHGGMGVYGEGVALNAGAIVTANRNGAVKAKIQGKLMDTGWHNIGAFIGDYARLNAQATVMPGRLIGTRAVIGPGVIVYRDVPPYTQIVLKQELEETKLPAP